MKLLELDIDVASTINKESLCYALCRFMPEVTKKDGSDYPGKTLYEIIVVIQKHINNKNLPWKLIDDPAFLDVKTVLDNVMKEMAAASVGVVKRQAEFIMEEYEEQLWRSGTLGEDTPKKLRDTVLFLLGINPALRAGDEHYDLRRDCPERRSQISFERENESGKRCLIYREDTVTKTNDGGLSNWRKERKVVRVYPSSNIERCPVRLVDKYVSLCPQIYKTGKKPNFYLRPLEKINPAQWYGEMPVGKNTLSKVVGKLLKSANLDGYFTNHSLRRTSATPLFQAGIDKKIVKEVTGHISDVLDKYQITLNKQKEEVSNVLQGGSCDGTEFKAVKPKRSEEPIMPSLELSVTNKNTSKSVPVVSNCSCKTFNLGDRNDLATMINDIVSRLKSSKAVIKLEIELSD